MTRIDKIANFLYRNFIIYGKKKNGPYRVNKDALLHALNTTPGDDIKAEMTIKYEVNIIPKSLPALEEAERMGMTYERLDPSVWGDIAVPGETGYGEKYRLSCAYTLDEVWEHARTIPRIADDVMFDAGFVEGVCGYKPIDFTNMSVDEQINLKVYPEFYTVFEENPDNMRPVSGVADTYVIPKTLPKMAHNYDASMKFLANQLVDYTFPEALVVAYGPSWRALEDWTSSIRSMVGVLPTQPVEYHLSDKSDKIIEDFNEVADRSSAVAERYSNLIKKIKDAGSPSKFKAQLAATIVQKIPLEAPTLAQSSDVFVRNIAKFALVGVPVKDNLEERRKV